MIKLNINAPVFYKISIQEILKIRLMLLIKPKNKQVWKKTLPQLGFNVGMQNIAILAAAYLLGWLEPQLQTIHPAAGGLAWLVAAFIYGQINLGLLIVILRLQHGGQISPAKIWLSEKWAIQINTLLLAAGGWILSYALLQFSWRGIAISRARPSRSTCRCPPTRGSGGTGDSRRPTGPAAAAIG